jgi:hypothetical protein
MPCVWHPNGRHKTGDCFFYKENYSKKDERDSKKEETERKPKENEFQKWPRGGVNRPFSEI